MDNFIGYLFSIFFFIIMPGYLFYLLRQSYRQIKSWTYYVHFKKGLETPELATPALQEYFTVDRTMEDGTIVINSKVNEPRLRKLIAAECKLPLADFTVSSHIIRMPNI